MSDENEVLYIENLSAPWQKDAEDHLVAVENHLVKAIISTCLCCLPFGIVAIVHATLVNPALRAGDHEGAWEASAKASFWGNLSIIVGIAQIIIIAFAIQPVLESVRAEAKIEAAKARIAKAQMASAVLVMESFESAHSSQVKKSGGLNFTAKDLLGDSSFCLIPGEYFTYTIVTDKRGNPIAFRATSKATLGEFHGTLITKYDERNYSTCTYNRSVEPEYMREIAMGMVPQFFK